MTTSKSRGKLTDPSPWIERFAAEVRSHGSVLDLACGGGRHGRLFLERSCTVVFLDRNISGIADIADNGSAEIIEADLETDNEWPLSGRLFDAVNVTNYLWRPIMPKIIAAVAPGGYLLYETFARGNETFDRPRNPEFLLRSGELLEFVRGQLEILSYGQLYRDAPYPRIVQRIAARRPHGSS